MNTVHPEFSCSIESFIFQAEKGEKAERVERVVHSFQPFLPFAPISQEQSPS